MKAKKQELIDFFKKHNGMVRFSAILKAGFHPDSLDSLKREGGVEKIATGLYRLTTQALGPYPDLVVVSLKVSRGVVCLLSALAFHEATDEIPKYINLAIPEGSRANSIKYPPVKFYRFAQKAWEAGLEEYEIEGRKIKVYNLAKTIADCFKFRNKIGTDVARNALKIAITEKGTKPKEIMRYAKICRVGNIIKPILEAML